MTKLLKGWTDFEDAVFVKKTLKASESIWMLNRITPIFCYAVQKLTVIFNGVSYLCEYFLDLLKSSIIGSQKSKHRKYPHANTIIVHTKKISKHVGSECLSLWRKIAEPTVHCMDIGQLKAISQSHFFSQGQVRVLISFGIFLLSTNHKYTFEQPKSSDVYLICIFKSTVDT